MRRFRIGHYLKTSLWFIPLLFVLTAIVLSTLTTEIDDGHVVPQSISGDPTAAMQILYLISFSMLTLTGLVLSLVVVVVQLAVGVFSARIVRQILQDRPSQAAIGLFAATFTYAILGIRRIRTTRTGGTVPGLTVLVAMALVLVCIATLLWYVDHIGQSLRVAALVGWVAKDTRSALETEYPHAIEGPEPDPGVIVAARSGVLFKLAESRLVAIAARASCEIQMLKGIGDFVPTGAPLARVTGELSDIQHARVRSCIGLGPERTLNEDVAYGIRMLVDTALSALASGPLADPTTAVQAIDRLHDILRQIAGRTLHRGVHTDADGQVRLRVPTMTWDGFVRLTFDEIRLAGAASPQVSRRLLAALDDLLTVAPADRRPALLRQRRLLQQLAGAAARTAEDRSAALSDDPTGIGAGDDVVASRFSRDEHENDERADDPV